MPNDPLLLPFLRAADAHEAQRCVEELIERQARPIVRDIVQRKCVGAPGGAMSSTPRRTWKPTLSRN